MLRRFPDPDRAHRRPACAAVAPAVLVALLATLAAAVPAPADPLDVVPYNDWTYAALYRLAAAGIAPLWATSTRPLTRFEVARMVAAALQRADAAGARLSPADRQALDALRDEFAEELRLIRAGQIRPNGSVRPGLAVTGSLASGDPPRFERRQNSSGELSRLYLSGGSGEFRLQIGRDTVWWGPGFRGAFLLSDNTGPLDALRLSYENDRLRVTKVIAPFGDPERYLYGLRVDWLARDHLRVGLGETVVGIGGFSPLYATSAVPLLQTFYLVHRWARATTDDNYNISLDFDWLVQPGVLLYGELYADDLTRPGNPYPHRIGGTVGLILHDLFRDDGRTTLRLEHSRATNWLYTTSTPAGDYVARGRPLGHWCAPDCELWSATVTRQLSPRSSLQLGYDLIRKGQGRLGETWANPDDAWARLYLSGVVETTHVLRGGFTWQAGQLRQAVSLTWSSTANAGHVAGQAGQGWFALWELSYGF